MSNQRALVRTKLEFLGYDIEILKLSLLKYPTLNYDDNRRTLMCSNFQEQSFVVCYDKY